MNVFILLTLLVTPALGMHSEYIIRGAEVTDATKYPFMVSLQSQNGKNLCGGAIISDRWVVTAAHCAVKSGIAWIVTGCLSIAYCNAHNRGVYIPMGYMMHERYSNRGRNIHNDLGLIKVNRRMVMSDTAQIIPIAAEGDEFANCVIMGWGRTTTGILPNPSDRLRETDVDIYTQDFCQGRWSGDQIRENHICVGLLGTSGACTTDSGGPLACEVSGTNGTMTLAGVFSFTTHTCEPSMPSVFTRISKYNAWIKDFAHHC